MHINSDILIRQESGLALLGSGRSVGRRESRLPPLLSEMMQTYSHSSVIERVTYQPMYLPLRNHMAQCGRLG